MPPPGKSDSNVDKANRRLEEHFLDGYATADDILRAVFPGLEHQLDLIGANDQIISLAPLPEELANAGAGGDGSLREATRRIRMGKSYLGTQTLYQAMIHEGVHVLQGDSSYRLNQLFPSLDFGMLPVGAFAADDKIFANETMAQLASEHTNDSQLQLSREKLGQFGPAYGNKKYIDYYREGLEVQPRIIETVAGAYQHSGEIPLNKEQLWSVMRDAGLKVPPSIAQQLDSPSQGLFSNLFRGKDSPNQTARITERSVQELNHALDTLTPEGQRLFWEEVLPSHYANFLETIGDGPGRERFGLGTNEFRPLRELAAATRGAHTDVMRAQKIDADLLKELNGFSLARELHFPDPLSVYLNPNATTQLKALEGNIERTKQLMLERQSTANKATERLYREQEGLIASGKISLPPGIALRNYPDFGAYTASDIDGIVLSYTRPWHKAPTPGKLEAVKPQIDQYLEATSEVDRLKTVAENYREDTYRHPLFSRKKQTKEELRTYRANDEAVEVALAHQEIAKKRLLIATQEPDYTIKADIPKTAYVTMPDKATAESYLRSAARYADGATIESANLLRVDGEWVVSFPINPQSHEFNYATLQSIKAELLGRKEKGSTPDKIDPSDIDQAKIANELHLRQDSHETSIPPIQSTNGTGSAPPAQTPAVPVTTTSNNPSPRVPDMLTITPSIVYDSSQVNSLLGKAIAASDNTQLAKAASNFGIRYDSEGFSVNARRLKNAGLSPEQVTHELVGYIERATGSKVNAQFTTKRFLVGPPDKNGDAIIRINYDPEKLGSALESSHNPVIVQFVTEKRQSIEREATQRAEHEAKLAAELAAKTAMEERQARYKGPTHIGDEINNSGLAVVHATNYMPIENPDGSVEITPHHLIDNGVIPRNTTHFALNHRVSGHMLGNWDAAPYAIIAPYEEMVSKNGIPAGFLATDTYWASGLDQRLVIPQATMVMPGEPSNGQLFDVSLAKTVYKHKGFTQEDEQNIIDHVSKDERTLKQLQDASGNPVKREKILASVVSEMAIDSTITHLGYDVHHGNDDSWFDASPALTAKYARQIGTHGDLHSHSPHGYLELAVGRVKNQLFILKEITADPNPVLEMRPVGWDGDTQFDYKMSNGRYDLSQKELTAISEGKGSEYWENHLEFRYQNVDEKTREIYKQWWNKIKPEVDAAHESFIKKPLTIIHANTNQSFDHLTYDQYRTQEDAELAAFKAQLDSVVTRY